MIFSKIFFRQNVFHSFFFLLLLQHYSLLPRVPTPHIHIVLFIMQKSNVIGYVFVLSDKRETPFPPDTAVQCITPAPRRGLICITGDCWQHLSNSVWRKLLLLLNRNLFPFERYASSQRELIKMTVL